MPARESNDKISWPQRYGSARIQQKNLLALERWQRENPTIKLAGLGAMAARESNNKICWPRRDVSARIQE
jgi:hypothetical protein